MHTQSLPCYNPIAPSLSNLNKTPIASLPHFWTLLTTLLNFSIVTHSRHLLRLIPLSWPFKFIFILFFHCLLKKNTEKKKKKPLWPLPFKTVQDCVPSSFSFCSLQGSPGQHPVNCPHLTTFPVPHPLSRQSNPSLAPWEGVCVCV